jgi:putative hydrolase of the HAD superfamily
MATTASQIRAVFFDLDGTLYDRDRLVEELFGEQFDVFVNELRGLPREQFLHDVRAMDDHGYGVKESGYSELVRRWEVDSALAGRLINHFWDAYDNHCRLPTDVRRTLGELRARGLKLAVVTNGSSKRQRRKLEVLGLGAAFDAILVSDEEGVGKPDPEIFRRALGRCGAAAHEVIFVGDHPVVDVQGAYRAGLVAVWKHVPYWSAVVPDAPVVHELSEVLRICGGPNDSIVRSRNSPS